MKKLVVLGTLLPVILLTSSIAAAFDLGKVHNLVVFGDSLSDNGNTFTAAGFPKPPYYKGRWTNGLDWVAYFTTIAGPPPPPSLLPNRGTNVSGGGFPSFLF